MARCRWIFSASTVNGCQNVRICSSFPVANVIIHLLLISTIKYFDVSAICDPPCINGGNCLSYNVCQCTKDFRGAQCQWGTERCATAKMNFNGGFKCSGTADAISCKLSCPKGVSFEFEPAEFYTCAYGSAEFLPKQVPRCVYGNWHVRRGF